jgi:type II secretory pathway pseudopilin PulG
VIWLTVLFAEPSRSRLYSRRVSIRLRILGKTMAYRKKENGFSITDLMLAIAIAGAASVIAVPSLKQWSRNYALQSAAMDLYAHMQTAKMSAIKENRPWTMNFNPGRLLGYEVHNSAGRTVKTVDFRTRYEGEILFTDPTAAKTFEHPIVTFNPSSLIDQNSVGYAYISGRVSDVHFTTLHAMLRPPAEREREKIIPGLCPRCHTDQVIKGGKTKVHI